MREHELSLKHKVIGVLGVSLPLLAALACSRSADEQAAWEFTSALTQGKVETAAALVNPNRVLRTDINSDLTSLAAQIRGCQLDTVVVQKSLMGSSQQANVNFKELCGPEQIVAGMRTKVRGLTMGLDQAGEKKYYVNPATTMAIPQAVTASSPKEVPTTDTKTNNQPSTSGLKAGNICDPNLQTSPLYKCPDNAPCARKQTGQEYSCSLTGGK